MSIGADSLTSLQRPIPLTRRDDLVVSRMRDRGAGSWVVKDPLSLQYHRLQAEQHLVLTLLNGRISIEEIRTHLVSEFPTATIEPRDVQRLIVELHQKGLLTSLRPGRGPSLRKAEKKKTRARWIGAVANIFYIRIRGFNPSWLLEVLTPLLGWLFSLPALILSLSVMLWSLLLVFVQWAEFSSRLPAFHQFFGWPNLIWLWLTIGATKLIHELGHAVCCRRMGAECHEIGFMLLVFSPTMYTEATDSWMLRSKWKRIAVASAGMYFESLLAAAAVFVWWNTQPGLVNHLALNVFAISSVTTALFNANPLLRYDGYYILSDWWEIPNLRQRADGVVRELFGRACLGLDPPPDPFLDESHRRKLLLYGVAAGIYRLMMLFGVAFFFYEILEPWGLEAVAVVMAVVSLGGALVRSVRQMVQMVKSAGVEEMNPTRVSITVAVLTSLVVGALIVPIPWHIESAFHLVPHDQRDVYVATPGILTEVHVRPGDVVKKDDLLARLTNSEKDDARKKLRLRKEMDQMQVEVAYALDDEARVHLAKEKLAGTEQEIADADRQAESLELRAPSDGRVVEPDEVAEPKWNPEATSLPRWNGHPLEPRNQGTWLERQTQFLSIAPDGRVDAVLFVDQSHRADVSVGQKIELKFDHLADRTFRAVVDRISLREKSNAPTSLSQKSGGELATVTDSKGQETLTSVAYQVTVTLEDETELLRPGMRGKARFLVDRRSAFDWGWRWVRQALKFRL